VRGLGDSEIRPDAVPEEGEKIAVIYMVPTPDGTSGFVMQVTKNNGTLYVTDALSLGDGDFDTVGMMLGALKGRQVVTTREVWETFLRGRDIKVKKRSLKSKFPVDAAVARIGKGEIKLTERASILTGYASSLGLEALEFMAESCSGMVNSGLLVAVV